MRKIKKKEINQKQPMSIKKRIILFATVGVIAVMAAILMIIENESGKIKIINNSDLKLEYLNAYFVDSEGMIDETIYEYAGVESNSKQSLDLLPVNLLGMEANLEIRFKFDGYEHKYLQDAGLFNDKFDGKITIRFDNEENGTIRMKVKASNGFLTSRLITCDEEYRINFQTGEMDE